MTVVVGASTRASDVGVDHPCTRTARAARATPSGARAGARAVVACMCLQALCPTSVHAVDYYVDPSLGSDAATGAIDTPLAPIQV